MDFPLQIEVINFAEEKNGQRKTKCRVWKYIADFKRPSGYLVKKRCFFYLTLYSFSCMYSTANCTMSTLLLFYYIHYVNATKYLKVKHK